jgi:hypothetical protein
MSETPSTHENRSPYSLNRPPFVLPTIYWIGADSTVREFFKWNWSIRWKITSDKWCSGIVGIVAALFFFGLERDFAGVGGGLLLVMTVCRFVNLCVLIWDVWVL